MNFIFLSVILLLATPQLDNSYGEDLILGFFDGLATTVDLSLIKKCAQNMDPIISQIADVINDIQHIDPKNIFPLVFKIFNIALSIYSELEPCISGSQELMELFNRIINLDIEKRLPFIITHSFRIIALLMDIQRQVANPYMIGKDIGTIVYLIAFTESVQDANDPVYFFLAGFFKALGQTITNDQIMSCLANGNQLWIDATALFELIKKTNWRSVSSVLATLMSVEKFVKEVVADLDGCKTSLPQLDALLKDIKKINITELVPDVIMNFGRITVDIQAIQADYAKSNWTGAGYDLGDIIAIFLPKTQDFMVQGADVLSFVTGLLEGLGVSIDVSQLVSCLQNAQGIIDDIMDAMNKLKKIDFSHILTIIEGLKELVSSVQDLLNKIMPCVNSPQDIQNLLNKLANINWSGVPSRVLKNLIEIIEDVGMINSGFSDGDYETAGKGVGDLIQAVLF